MLNLTNRTFNLVLAISISFILTACGNSGVQVASVYDGDTFTLKDGQKIRLVQIDTPELKPIECYAEEARQALLQLLELDTQDEQAVSIQRKNLSKKNLISLREDTSIDSVDSFGRTLSYVYVETLNINIKLVEIGAATPYFFNGQKGEFAKALEDAAQIAQEEKRGLWAACPGTIYDPDEPLTAVAGNVDSGQMNSDEDSVLLYKKGQPNCSASYLECVPLYPPDYNCKNLVPLGLIHVIGPDVHRLDRDGDGLACESNAR